MSRRLKLLTIGLATVAILVLSLGGVTLADDSQEGKAFGPRMGKTGHFEAISGVLGLTPDEIKAQLQDGKSIADIAADQGFSDDELKDAMLAAMTEKLQQKVADGTITQEQADNMLERMQERAENGMAFGPGTRRAGCFGVMSDMQGLTPEEIQAQLAEKLQQKVEDGTITQERADKILERMQEIGAEGKRFGPPMGHFGFGNHQGPMKQQQQSSY